MKASIGLRTGGERGVGGGGGWWRRGSAVSEISEIFWARPALMIRATCLYSCLFLFTRLGNCERVCCHCSISISTLATHVLISCIVQFFFGQERLHRPPPNSEGARMLMEASTGLVQILL